ncbi:hypothetical protein N7533_005332 [Penicillium manginii]|uniref:uncharacterized protein n=1 Tax=Penicillium manginii TaxID=203109 RepID=UPI002547446B|nr:uncharacterized protein N7533_005332 [Penicillium manginii]KAJ5755789.1 hypothetical protein N7533_005332 [Penicillium manginii]
MAVPRGMSGYSPDCFVSLPMETRMHIAIYLATADFLALRHASRSMAKVFNIQSFWKSRFHAVQDRGFLAYLANNPQDDETTDWRLMYRCTANIDLMLKRKFPEHSCTHESIWNIWILKSLWENTQWLRQRYSMTQASYEQIVLYNHMLTELHWTEFYAGLECNRASRQGKDNDLCEDCGAEHVPLIQAIPLEHSVVSLAVSILNEGPQTVITGFELVSGEKDVVNKVLGYRLLGGQVTISLRGQELRGFSIVSSRGNIHALQPIFFNNDVKPGWVGQPELCFDDLYDESYSTSKSWIKRSSTEVVLERGITAFCGKFDKI